LAIPDAASFLSAYKEIFVEGIYRFSAEGATPKILDLGANIGLSVLFFKRMHPGARIIALEADPEIFRYLRQNVVGNGYSDVALVNKAAWDEDTMLRFAADGADGGRVAAGADPDIVEVEAVDIREYLKGESFDLIKMDIEGAEECVLPACADYLDGVRHLFVEYHSRADREQCLDRLLAILKEKGYRVHVHSVFCSASPFIEIAMNTGFDLQLNIFGYRR
jgi:FkbM family methyltransferase